MAYISSVSSDVTTYEPVSTSGTITYSTSDTDWSEVVDSLVEAQTYRKDEYETRLAEQEYVLEQLEAFQDSLSELNTALEDLDSVDEFLNVEVSGGGDEIEVDATGSADTGTHIVVVNQLALNDVWINSGYGFSDTTDEVAEKDTTLSFSIDGTECSVDVQAGTTLEELVDQINADPDVSGLVTASILDDGSSQYFVLSSQETGADQSITITDTGTLTGITSGNLENTQAACDAQIKVDGFPSGDDEWISRSTNDIDDVIDGMTLTLNDTTDADGVRISTSYDEDALIENIETFVSAVNQAIVNLQALTGRIETTYTTSDDEEEVAPTIESYALDLMYSEIKYMLASVGQGFTRYDADTGTGDVYSSLSQLGISTDADEDSDTWGQLVLDDDELEEAVSANAQAVAALFAENDSVSISGSGLTYISSIETVTQGGEYEVDYEISDGKVLWATIDGVAMEIDGQTILAPDECDAAGLYLRVNETDDGTYSNTVGVKQGKIGELNTRVEEWNSSDGGTLSILIDSMEESIESLEDDIYDEEQRLDALETELLRKYAALEATLSTYSNLEAQLESTISSLDDD